MFIIYMNTINNSKKREEGWLKMSSQIILNSSTTIFLDLQCIII